MTYYMRVEYADGSLTEMRSVRLDRVNAAFGACVGDMEGVRSASITYELAAAQAVSEKEEKDKNEASPPTLSRSALQVEISDDDMKEVRDVRATIQRAMAFGIPHDDTQKILLARVETLLGSRTFQTHSEAWQELSRYMKECLPSASPPKGKEEAPLPKDKTEASSPKRSRSALQIEISDDDLKEVRDRRSIMDSGKIKGFNLLDAKRAFMEHVDTLLKSRTFVTRPETERELIRYLRDYDEVMRPRVHDNTGAAF